MKRESKGRLRARVSGLWEHDVGLGDHRPLLLGDVVLMDVDVVAVGVEALVENKRRVHKRTWINKASTFANFHFLNIEDETTVEDMEGCSAFATEQNDFVVSNLVRQAHVGGHPLRLVHLGCADLLPHVARDVVALNGVNDPLLVNSATESEDVVVFEDTQRSAGARHAHISDQLPFVLLRVVYFAVAVDLVAYEGADDVDEVLDGAYRMICVRVVHVAHLVKDSK